MNRKEVGKAERAFINAKIEISKLKKERNNTKDKKAAKKLLKQIVKIEESFIHLKRNVYLENKKKQDSVFKPSEEDIIKTEAELLEQLINQDLLRRTNKKVILSSEEIKLKPEKPACQSCGAPLKDVYGVIRCKCN